VLNRTLSPKLRHLLQPPKLVRIADRVKAGNLAVLDDEADQRVELAARVEPGRHRAIDQQRGDLNTRRDLRKARPLLCAMK